MYSLILYVFFSTLILVQCKEFELEEEYPTKYTVLDECTTEEIIEIRMNRMNAMLKPRERLVMLKPKDGYGFTPPTVTVKRCNGFCPNRWSPMPTKTMEKEFIVHKFELKNPMSPKCVAVKVHEHMACKCMCMKTEKNCKPSQEFIQNSCHCQCKDRELRESECESKYGMHWYDEDCSCACTKKIMACSSGQKWDRKSCDCMPE